MYKNLSKSRFILILCIAIFLLVILLSQFIVLSVLRNKNQSLNQELSIKENEQEISNQKVANDKAKEDALRKEGFVYDEGTVTVEE